MGLFSYLVEDDYKQQAKQKGEMTIDEAEQPFDVVRATSEENNSSNGTNLGVSGRNGDTTARSSAASTVEASSTVSIRAASAGATNTNDSVEEVDDPLYRHSTNEHRYGRSRKTRTQTPTYEVGDLPTLSLCSVLEDVLISEPSVGGQQQNSRSGSCGGSRNNTLLKESMKPQLRPMSPPSRAGLDDPEV